MYNLSAVNVALIEWEKKLRKLLIPNTIVRNNIPPLSESYEKIYFISTL